MDYLRQADPAGLSLGLELPSDEERQMILDRIQTAPVHQFPTLSSNSHIDSVLARKMLGGIGTHRLFAAAGTAGPEVYNTMALATAGHPDSTRAMADNVDARVRDKAMSGEWHSLNIASVSSSALWFR